MLNASKHEARPKISSPNPLRRIRRAVEDYDFDRLEVEAQQCVELTSTNRSFGLIIKLSHAVMRELEAVLVLVRTIHSMFGSGPNLYASQICCQQRRPLAVLPNFNETISKFRLCSCFHGKRRT